MLRPSSTLRAGSQNPAPSCLSNLAEVVSAAAPQTTKKTLFRKMEDSHVSTTGAGVSLVPRSSNQTQKLLETGSPNPSSSFQYQQSVNSRRDSELGCVWSAGVYNSLCERNVPVDKLVTYTFYHSMYLTLSVRTLKSQLFKPSSKSFGMQEVLKRALHDLKLLFLL